MNWIPFRILIQATWNFRVLFYYWHDWCSALSHQRFSGDRNQIKKITSSDTNFNFSSRVLANNSFHQALSKRTNRNDSRTNGVLIYLFTFFFFDLIEPHFSIHQIKREECIHTNISGVISHLWIFTVVRWGTPLDKPFRYVPPRRVWFLLRFGLKTGFDLSHFGPLEVAHETESLLCRIALWETLATILLGYYKVALGNWVKIPLKNNPVVRFDTKPPECRQQPQNN